ncbi:helix-turn-helix domain-containing protein [Streptococcus sinensis]|uniref:Putative transcriptional regulator PlcR n=1 Tax=Streptococcus sinensis TaxID=176090 RepID=A0A0A0DGY9_9STRE|nr:helix-turn-helix domain-containing protein [Streptococcus sinensis]KGM38006.1 putative transcriptional regulator PlcR [Streptococcus sinensis]
MDKVNSLKHKIAVKFKNRRLQLGLSQKELAEGICAQGIISKIENEELLPSIEIFIHLVNKLKLSHTAIEEFFNIDYLPSDKFYSLDIKKLIHSRDYATLKYVLSMVNADTLDSSDRMIFDWLTAITIYHVHHDKEAALKKLETLLASIHETDFIFLKTKSSIASIYSDSGEHDKALEIFKEILPDINKFADWMDKVKYYYSLSRSFFFKNEYDKSLYYNSLAITLILEEKSLFLLGDCYLARAYILQKQQLLSEAYQSCQNAMAIFNITNDILLKNMAFSLFSSLKEEYKYEEV